VKLTFAKGASLKDPARSSTRVSTETHGRAIDIHEGEEVDESAFKALVRQAVALTVLASRNLRRKRSPEDSARERVRHRGLNASLIDSSAPEIFVGDCGFVLEHRPDNLDRALAAREHFPARQRQRRVSG